MKKVNIIILLLLFPAASFSQRYITLDGYLNDMQTVYHVEGVDWLWENQIHNRLNLNIYPSNWLKISIQARNRFIQGNTYGNFPGYGTLLGKDGGFIDMNYSFDDNYNKDVGYVYTTMIDRAFAEITLGDFVGTFGRQRINWGQTFAWNPNDIFNSYSYFDVDYPERPGSDAVRLQYYTGMASNLEVAAKIDSANNITAAGYFRFNAKGYDFQVIGGILAESDLVLGAGWSGNIFTSSFRGELSYFHDLEEFSDTTGHLLASAGIDYTFGNSLWLQGEVLYSGFGKEMKIHNFLQMFSLDMNVKSIGFTEWSLFVSASYPFTPLISGSLAGMYFPDWKGFYMGPSFDLSITESVKFSLIFQGFSAELENLFGQVERQNTFIGYARLKWSF